MQSAVARGPSEVIRGNRWYSVAYSTPPSLEAHAFPRKWSSTRASSAGRSSLADKSQNRSSGSSQLERMQLESRAQPTCVIGALCPRQRSTSRYERSRDPSLEGT